MTNILDEILKRDLYLSRFKGDTYDIISERLEKAEACAFSVVEAVKHLKALTGLASAEVTKH